MYRSKNYKASMEIVPNEAVEADKAFELVVQTAKAKFDESIEAHFKLGVDSRHADQQVRGTVALPNGTGKAVRVLAIVKGGKEAEAKVAGADFVGAEEMIQKIQTDNWFDYDVIVTSPDMMGQLGRAAKLLGPKGLMPNPKSGTVTPDVAKAIQEIKSGKIEYRLDKTNIIHCPIGKASFGKEKLLENYEVLLGAIQRAKPAAAKGTYIKSISVCSTMGPGIKIIARDS